MVCHQVIDQGASLVDKALANGKMFELPGWKLISEAFAEHTVHFIGLLSDGGVHSRYNQLVGCVKGAVERGAKRIRIHILTGGQTEGMQETPSPLWLALCLLVFKIFSAGLWCSKAGLYTARQAEGVFSSQEAGTLGGWVDTLP
jgi:hypothetical protein